MLRRGNNNNAQQQPAGQQATQATNRTYPTIIQPAHVEYDRYTSALRLSFGHGQYRGFGVIDLTPVFEEKRGAEAKKGESLFNYNDKMMVRISAQDAIVLRHQLKAIAAGEIDETVLNTSANKSISLVSRPYDICDLPEQYKGTRIGIISTEMKDGAADPLEYLWTCEHIEYEVYQGLVVTSSDLFIEIFDTYLQNVIKYCTGGEFVASAAAVSAYGGSAASSTGGSSQPRSSFRRRGGEEAAQTNSEPQETGDNMGSTESQPAAQRSAPVERSNAMAAARAARQQSVTTTTTTSEPAVVTSGGSVGDFLNGFDQEEGAEKF